ncbi:hypothetical protein AB7M15_007203 [Bradyrhizobium ottawaense]
MQGTITARSGNRQLVLFQEVDAHRVVVDHDELFGLGQRARAHLERRKAADADGAIERPFHVLGGNGRPVVEFGVLLQLEGDRHVVDPKLLGELALELVAVVIGHPAGAALHLVADQAVVAIPGHLIAGHVGADAMDVEIVRAAFRDDQQRLGAGVGIGRGNHLRHRRKRRPGGQSGNGLEEIAALHEIAPTQSFWLEPDSQSSCQGLTSIYDQGNRLKSLMKYSFDACAAFVSIVRNCIQRYRFAYLMSYIG